MHASPYWKKMLADFLEYACTTDDIDGTTIPTYETEMLKEKVALQVDTDVNELNLLRQDLLLIALVFLEFHHITNNDFYTYSALEFDRLHDDLSFIRDTAWNRQETYRPRIKG